MEAERRKAEGAERARLAEVERQKQEELKRQANKEHQRQFNREALQALIAAGFDDSTATKFLELVIKGEVPHLSMNY